MRCIAAVLSLALAGAIAAGGPGPARATQAPEGAEVYFINLSDGMKVTSPFRVLIGLKNMGLAPANLDEFGRTGHHHLLVNAPMPDPNATIPERNSGKERYIHLGGGQSQLTLELPNGTHELQLLVGDHEHVPHAPMIKSERITIEVVAQSDTLCKPIRAEASGCEPAES
jgi:hypothetical protein